MRTPQDLVVGEAPEWLVKHQKFKIIYRFFYIITTWDESPGLM